MNRNQVMREVVGVREDYVAKGRLEKAREVLREQLVWLALGAIAEGCDDPAGLAWEVLGLYDEAHDEE